MWIVSYMYLGFCGFEFILAPSKMYVRTYMRCVSLVLDEMKVQEKLVFDASTGDVVGLVDVGEIGNN